MRPDMPRWITRVSPPASAASDAAATEARTANASGSGGGSGSAIASSSLVTEWVKGKTVDEAMTIKNTQIAQELSLPPVKIHCSVLAEDAIKAAIKDYQQKQRQPAESEAANA